MILIDTDHASYLKYPEVIGVAIATVEERMRGWLAVIAKERKAIRQVAGYQELARLFEFYQEFEIIPFDIAAAQKFEELRSQRLRVGTMDLKIAATALVHDALLLSANLRDFKRVAGLRAENWLD
jgi:tRNA(fMet)-specific endonuclease VapC